MKRLALSLLVCLPAFAADGQPRMASDFEIARMKQQIATSRDFLSQLSGHLNLGDLYLSRSESETARSQYAMALEIAGREARRARKASDIMRYATAVGYSALADARLGKDGAAFDAAEEAIRYTSGSAKSWNLYSSAMTLLGRTAKAASAARNAVTIARGELARSPTVANRLDLATNEYTLASAVDDDRQAELLLREIKVSLRSDDFAALRRDIARRESFEIYSSARGDAAAYLSLLNRAGLRLAGLLEKRGDVDGARHEYESVLASRTDDPTALSALARLSTADEQQRYFAQAFDANPFSMTLIRQYQRHIDENTAIPGEDTAGARMRAALIEMQRGENRLARTTLDSLVAQFPGNDTLRALRRQTEVTAGVPAFLTSNRSGVAPSSAELRQIIGLLQSDGLTPEQRASLDQTTLTSAVTFDSATKNDGQTIFESGSIGGVRFRFGEPTAFTGTFPMQARLTYRILGATESGGADALLLEPVRIAP